jgi:DNA-binding beta-propeller fold protein YncE
MRQGAKLPLLFTFLIIGILSVTLTVSTFSAQGKEDPKGKTHGIYSPIRLAFTPEGNLLVSDYRANMILTVDSRTNKVIRWFAVKGRPLAVAYARGRVYVGNETKGCIEVYNRAGRSNFKLGGTMGPVQHPTDMAIDPRQGRIFVVDGLEKSVKVFSFKGQLINTFPDSAPNPDVLTHPTGITLDREKKEVLVSDYGDSREGIFARVQIFNYSGELVGTLSGKGSGWFSKPKFSRPQGLAVDGDGHIFLVDCYSCEVLVFDIASGSLMETLGGFGSEPGKMLLPLDIVMDDASRDIFVTNNRSARIEIFRQGGQL